MARATMWKADTLVLDREGQTAHIDVVAGQRVVFLSRQEKPTVMPEVDPGTYLISVDELKRDAALPIVAVFVPEQHVGAWLALNDRQIGRMLDRVEREVRAIRATGGRLQ